MPATTVHYSIPYPVPTDKVADAPAAMQALAETVDTQVYAAIPYVEAARDLALADVETARAAALADVNSASTSAAIINARIDDLSVLNAMEVTP